VRVCFGRRHSGELLKVSPPEDHAPQPPTRVLLADDHPALRAGIRLRLEANDGFQVVGEASDGAAAIHEIVRAAPHVALVDLRMPGIDGLELTRICVRDHPGTRVVLLSALTEAQLVQRALDAGAWGYVAKQSSLDVVVDAVVTVAGGGRYVDPSLLAGVFGGSADQLTDREREVLQMAANGFQNKVIANELGLGEETVKTHLSNVMRKLDAASRTEAVAAALRRSIIE
jgi:DNA-binding NarL/FixJ family response regulator